MLRQASSFIFLSQLRFHQHPCSPNQALHAPCCWSGASRLSLSPIRVPLTPSPRASPVFPAPCGQYPQRLVGPAAAALPRPVVGRWTGCVCPPLVDRRPAAPALRPGCPRHRRRRHLRAPRHRAASRTGRARLTGGWRGDARRLSRRGAGRVDAGGLSGGERGQEHTVCILGEDFGGFVFVIVRNKKDFFASKQKRRR